MEKFWVVEIEKGVWHTRGVWYTTVVLEDAKRFQSEELAKNTAARIKKVFGWQNPRVAHFCKTGNALIEVI